MSGLLFRLASEPFQAPGSGPCLLGLSKPEAAGSFASCSEKEVISHPSLVN